MHVRTALFVLATAASALAATTAHAGGEPHSDAVNATGACNGALPSYEGALRKRALAIANEGTAPAFVSCSVPTDGFQNQGYQAGALTFLNRTGNPVAFNCTMVAGVASGLAPGLEPAYYTKLVAVAANGGVQVPWLTSEYGVEIFERPINFSCQLPAGVEIALIGGNYVVEPAPK